MKVVILGSTGSVGKSAIDVCRAESHEIVGLSCDKNIDILYQQYLEFKPEFLAVESQENYRILSEKLYNEPVTIFGTGGHERIASEAEYDVILNSIVGIAGLGPAYKAAKSGKRLAIANKESLVAFGEELVKTAKKYSTEIIPVDSEHSAIFQCLQGEKKNKISKVLLTASGGPLRSMSISERANCDVETALKHPNWSMGKKITIDSATMMNKGLEFIEAMRLFELKPSQIEILIHPESIVHSAVQFEDSSIIAQMSVPDMKLPIQYAINFPSRSGNSGFRIKELSFSEALSLNFFPADYTGFPCLALAKVAAEKGGFYPCALNSANEFAVQKFLEGKIGFYDISDIVSHALSLEYLGNYKNIDDIIYCHNYVLKKSKEYFEQKKGIIAL